MPKPILLAIDDDTSVLEAVVQDLRRHYGQDYRIVRAASGAAALDICRQLQERKDIVALFLSDSVGIRVRDRLTPKEMQIVALIVQGCKNKDIAEQLGTKEQVIKNYLRSIYDKSGVSDRLELALFTIHHRALAEAAAKAGNLIQMKTA